jgi:hypothetical protein
MTQFTELQRITMYTALTRTDRITQINSSFMHRHSILRSFKSATASTSLVRLAAIIEANDWREFRAQALLCVYDNTACPQINKYLETH